jgi:enolase-phosphatase E1
MGFAAYLLDIEGTTTPIDFVTRTLFPYSRKHLRAYVESHEEELAQVARALAEEEDATEHWTDLVGYLEWLMDHDRKSTGLKTIQGLIWESGYRSGELLAEVYDDVEPVMRKWISEGATVHIFSSGSVLAQKLLFGHLPNGDLTPLISSYFDTTTGPKREPTSYHKIAVEIGKDPSEILFLSDISEEVDAARAAGMAAVQVLRDSEVNDYPRSVSSFSHVASQGAPTG